MGEKENSDRKEMGSDNIKGENLGENKTKEEDLSFGAPDGDNKYQFYAIVDTDNAVSESNENDNRSGTIACRVHGRPDIKVSALELSDGRVDFTSGEFFKARATFTNSGGEPFEDVPVRWYLDNTHFANDNMRHWNIEHNDTKHEEVNLVQALAVGRHALKVCADFSSDKNQKDNCRETVFNILPPKPGLNPILAPNIISISDK